MIASRHRKILREHWDTLLSGRFPVEVTLVLFSFSLVALVRSPALAGWAFGLFVFSFMFAVMEKRVLDIVMLTGTYYVFRFQLIESATGFRYLSDFIIVYSALVLAWLLATGRARLRWYDAIFVAWGVYAFVIAWLNGVPALPAIIQVRAMVAVYPLFMLVRELGFRVDMSRIAAGLRYYELFAWWLFVQAFVEKASGKALLPTMFVEQTFISPTNWPRVYGWATNPNSLGAVCVLLIAFGLLLAARGWRTPSFSRSIALYFGTLVLSVSRSAMWGLVVFILVVIVTRGLEGMRGRDLIKLVRRPLVIGTTAALVAVLLGNAIPVLIDVVRPGETGFGVFGRFITDEGEVSASVRAGRIFSLRTGITLATESAPSFAFGHGPATYGSAGSAFWRPPLYDRFDVPTGFYADLFFIMMLVEVGIVGLMLYLGGLAGLAWSNRTTPRGFAAGIAAVFVLWCLFYNVVEIHMVFFPLLLLLGIPFPRSAAEDNASGG